MNINFENGCKSLQKKEYQEAIDNFSLVLAADAKHAASLERRAKAYAGLKSYDLAVKDSEMLVSIETENADYQSNHALILYLMGRKEEAIASFNISVSLDSKNPYRYSSRAFVKERMGDLKGALADYERTIELDPEDSIAYNNKGLIEEKLGRKEKSKQSFIKADHLGTKPKGFIEKQKNSKVHKLKVPTEKPQATVEKTSSDLMKNSNNKRINTSLYFDTLRGFFTDSKLRGDFFDFVKKIFTQKK